MTRTLTAAALAFTALLAAPALAQAQSTHPFSFPQPSEGEEFFVVIEIPAGSATKYEIDAQTGLVFVDRFLSMPVVYPPITDRSRPPWVKTAIRWMRWC